MGGAAGSLRPMILRCTAKMLRFLGARAAGLVDLPPSDDDWYLNLLWVERRKCLLLTHAGTLFPVFVGDVRKAQLMSIRPYVVSLIEGHLRSEELPPETLGHLDPHIVQLAKTASRSILGVMNDAAFDARYRIEAMSGIDRADALFLNRFLRCTLHNRGAGGRDRVREQRAMIEQTVEELAPLVGTRPACRALGASPATIYRRRRPPAPRPRRPRPTPARALSEQEREAMLELLHSPRFARH